MPSLQIYSVAILSLLTSWTVGVASDELAVRRWLQRPIIGSESTLQEVQEFAEKRVPQMPTVESTDAWKAIAAQIRTDVLDKVVFRGEASRWRKLPTKVEWLDQIDGGDGYRIKKLRYEAVPGLWIPALLYEPIGLNGKVPVVLNVNGHDREDGKAADYKQLRCINLAKRGMIALNVEWLGMGQLHSPGMAHYAMNQLDLCGTSGLSPFYLSMKRGLDILLDHPLADPERVGVAGLSGGGWQTIFISSLDTRVTLANPVAGYSSFVTRTRHFKDLGDSEQTPSDLAAYADYTHLTAMLAPRAGLLTYNETDDCCFESTYALQPLLNAARPVYRLFSQEDRLRSHVNVDPGTHNFGIDNRQALYRMIRDNFFSDVPTFSVKEIDSTTELKSKADLNVPLPPNNGTFNSLAVELAASLPRVSVLPSDAIAAKRWQKASRKTLSQIVRWDETPADLVCRQQDSSTRDGVRISYWRLQVDGEWTVPATEMSPPDATSTVIVIADEGRVACSALIARLLTGKQRILAIDPFYFGESKVSQNAPLFAFMVATVGHRPLGIQAGQVAAVARWSREVHGDSVTIIAEGARTSMIALVSAAIEEQAITSVELNGSYGSLKEVIEQNQLANQTPELFCFGLLKEFDVLHLSALIAPRRVVFQNASERAKAELKPLADWYTMLQQPHQPLR